MSREMDGKGAIAWADAASYCDVWTCLTVCWPAVTDPLTHDCTHAFAHNHGKVTRGWGGDAKIREGGTEASMAGSE